MPEEKPQETVVEPVPRARSIRSDKQEKIAEPEIVHDVLETLSQSGEGGEHKRMLNNTRVIDKGQTQEGCDACCTIF